MNDLLAAALRFAELGYAVFPCAPGRKQPLTARGFLDATTDADQIDAWWSKHPKANVAIPTTGLVVIDVDGPDNPWLADDPDRIAELATGALAVTPRGGKHYIFRAPERRSFRCQTGQIAARVDVRADGGYILVPPSQVGGKAYRFVPGMELDQPRGQLRDPPAWLVAELGGPATSSPTSPRVAAGAAGGNQIPNGQRNATLARLGGTMRRVGMSRSEISAALNRVNQERCAPPLSPAEVERIAESVARYEPDQVSVAVVEDHWTQDFEKPIEQRETAPIAVDPGPLPVELLRVPGFVSEVMDHCVDTAPYPNQALAFCGALALQAFLAGRKVRDQADNRTNIYLLGLAFSSVGKDWPRKLNTQVVHHVGMAGCLAPLLTEAADSITRITKTVTNWIAQNKDLVVTVLKVGAAVLAGGAALVILGAAISGIGTALGALGTIITGAGSAVGVLGSVLGGLLSPIGLVIAGLGGLAAYLVYATDAGSQALQWLGERFNDLKDTALAAWQGIGDALAAGDLGLAAKILWLTLKMEWQKGVNFLEGKWLEFKGAFVAAWSNAVFAVARLATDAWAGLQVGWVETVDFLADSWSVFINLLMKGWNRFAGFFQKVWARIQGLFGDTDAQVEIDRINAEIAADDQRLDENRDQAILERDQARQKKRDAIEAERAGANVTLDQMQAQEQADREARHRVAVGEAEDALANAQQEWQDALAEAARKRADAEQAGPLQRLRPLDLPDPRGLDELIDTTKKKIDVSGTFNPFAVRGLGADSLSERTAKAAEKIADNTKRLLQEAQHGGLVFA